MAKTIKECMQGKKDSMPIMKSLGDVLKKKGKKGK